MDLERLAFDLRRHTTADVRFDPGSRHLYATDSSNYRHLPLGVVLPRTGEDLAATVEACRNRGVPVTLRGAGTSLAGQATNRAVIVDASRYLNRIIDIDPERRTATVQPGVVLSDLQEAAAPHGLRFGPDPATQNRCTLGGMIGNNSCGPHSLRTGRTSDNVRSLDVLTGAGVRLAAGRMSLAEARARSRQTDPRGRLLAGLLDLRDEAAALVEERFPTIPRRVSGINLDELLHPEHLDLGRALVGTEGTCAITLAAEVALVDRPRATTLAVIAYDRLDRAGDDVPILRASQAIAVEGIDDNVVVGAPKHPGARLLPEGRGWLLLEFAGADLREAEAAARQFLADRGGHDTGTAVVTDPDAQRQLWDLRAVGLGTVTFIPGRPVKWPGWEDAAIPPERVGEYLRQLGALLDGHGLEAAIYGHFGDGCVHTKIGFDHTTDSGRRTFRRFVEEAADLAISLGGCLSGEHGDGQARGELLERQFGPDLLAAMRRFTRLFDPDGLLNPGVAADGARPLDADLRMADHGRMTRPASLVQFPQHGDDVLGAATRCIGVGTCRRDDDIGTMCPSWRVTHEEKHSTRGRARLLFELLRGEIDRDLDEPATDEEAVAEALELCLSCKACKSECPAGVDLAAMKADFNHRRWSGRVRPPQHYAFGLIRRVLELASRAPKTVNRLAGSPVTQAVASALGVTEHRRMPPLPASTFTASFGRRGGASHDGPPVLLWPDTFTDHLDPHIAADATRVLEAAGFTVTVPDRPVCCGRPLMDPGMLEQARRTLTRLVETLAPYARDGTPILGLEPGCLSMLRDELTALLPDHPDTDTVARATVTLPELLARPEADLSPWEGAFTGRSALVHGHCHHKALWGMEADTALLARLGLRWREPDAGCCGLAGSFGYGAGEPYEVSVAAAERVLAPAVRAHDDGALVITDGWSCRTQIEHTTGRSAHHLATVLASALPPTTP